MKKFSPRQLVLRAAKRYSTARGVLSERRRRAHADGLVTKAEAVAIREQEAEVRAALQLLRKRRAQMPKKSMREAAFAVAEAHLHVREVGGNNRGKLVEKIIKAAGGTPGEAWCGDFDAYCYLLAGSKMVTRAWAYVPTLEKVLTLVRRPLRGHVVIYNWNGGVADHTGLFDRWAPEHGKGYFFAIEGNTRPGVGSNVSDAGGGEGVHRKLRHVSEVDSFRRVIR